MVIQTRVEPIESCPKQEDTRYDVYIPSIGWRNLAFAADGRAYDGCLHYHPTHWAPEGVAVPDVQ